MARQEPIRPSVGWFGIAAGVALLGIVFGVVIVVRTVVGYFDRIDDFQRVDVPDGGTVTLEDGDYTIYHEFIGADDEYRTDFITPDVDVTVTAPDGSDVSLDDYDTDVSYDTGDHEGVAVYSFTAEEAGEYQIDAEGEPSELAVGKGLGRGVVGGVVGALALGLGGAVIGTVIAIVVAVARSRERQRRRIAFTRSQSGWPPAPGQAPGQPPGPYGPYGYGSYGNYGSYGGWQQPAPGAGPQSQQPQPPQQPHSGQQPQPGQPPQPQSGQQPQQSPPGQPPTQQQPPAWTPPPPPPPPP